MKTDLNKAQGPKTIKTILALCYKLQGPFLFSREMYFLLRSKRKKNENFQKLRFQRQREHTTINLSFSIFTSTSLLPVHLQRALSTIKGARNKQQSQNSRHFPNVYFQVTFFLPLLSLLLKLPIIL